MVNDDEIRERRPLYSAAAMKRKRKPPSPQAHATATVFIPNRIVTGGQTGVDRAGLDVAIALGIAHGGWCPRGRRSEDGTIPSCYDLTENDSTDYTVRTRQNVIDSDATLILYEQRLRGGTLLTQSISRDASKPHLCKLIQPQSLDEIRTWLQEHRPSTLNIAGPRESSFPGIGSRAFDLLLAVFAT